MRTHSSHCHIVWSPKWKRPQTNAELLTCCSKTPWSCVRAPSTYLHPAALHQLLETPQSSRSPSDLVIKYITVSVLINSVKDSQSAILTSSLVLSILINKPICLILTHLCVESDFPLHWYYQCSFKFYFKFIGLFFLLIKILKWEML